MQTQDFETHPLGTGAELARLSDTAQEFADMLRHCAAFADKDLYREIRDTLWRNGFCVDHELI